MDFQNNSKIESYRQKKVIQFDDILGKINESNFPAIYFHEKDTKNSIAQFGKRPETHSMDQKFVYFHIYQYKKHNYFQDNYREFDWTKWFKKLSLMKVIHLEDTDLEDAQLDYIKKIFELSLDEVIKNAENYEKLAIFKHEKRKISSTNSELKKNQKFEEVIGNELRNNLKCMINLTQIQLNTLPNNWNNNNSLSIENLEAGEQNLNLESKSVNFTNLNNEKIKMHSDLFLLIGDFGKIDKIPQMRVHQENCFFMFEITIIIISEIFGSIHLDFSDEFEKMNSLNKMESLNNILRIIFSNFSTVQIRTFNSWKKQDNRLSLKLEQLFRKSFLPAFKFFHKLLKKDSISQKVFCNNNSQDNAMEHILELVKLTKDIIENEVLEKILQQDLIHENNSIILFAFEQLLIFCKKELLAHEYLDQMIKEYITKIIVKQINISNGTNVRFNIKMKNRIDRIIDIHFLICVKLTKNKKQKQSREKGHKFNEKDYELEQKMMLVKFYTEKVFDNWTNIISSISQIGYFTRFFDYVSNDKILKKMILFRIDFMEFLRNYAYNQDLNLYQFINILVLIMSQKQLVISEEDMNDLTEQEDYLSIEKIHKEKFKNYESINNESLKKTRKVENTFKCYMLNLVWDAQKNCDNQGSRTDVTKSLDLLFEWFKNTQIYQENSEILLFLVSNFLVKSFLNGYINLINVRNIISFHFRVIDELLLDYYINNQSYDFNNEKLLLIRSIINNLNALVSQVQKYKCSTINTQMKRFYCLFCGESNQVIKQKNCDQCGIVNQFAINLSKYLKDYFKDEEFHFFQYIDYQLWQKLQNKLKNYEDDASWQFDDCTIKISDGFEISEQIKNKMIQNFDQKIQRQIICNLLYLDGLENIDIVM